VEARRAERREEAPGQNFPVTRDTVREPVTGPVSFREELSGRIEDVGVSEPSPGPSVTRVRETEPRPDPEGFEEPATGRSVRPEDAAEQILDQLQFAQRSRARRELDARREQLSDVGFRYRSPVEEEIERAGSATRPTDLEAGAELEAGRPALRVQPGVGAGQADAAGVLTRPRPFQMPFGLEAVRPVAAGIELPRPSLDLSLEGEAEAEQELEAELEAEQETKQELEQEQEAKELEAELEFGSEARREAEAARRDRPAREEERAPAPGSGGRGADDEDPLAVGYGAETYLGFGGVGIAGGESVEVSEAGLEEQAAGGAPFGELLPALTEEQAEAYEGSLDFFGVESPEANGGGDGAWL
jgi:hypothetical protein